MAFDFRLPDLAEGMTEAEVVDWKVNEGDSVDLDQPVVEVMSDKATVEIPSPRAGTILRINYKAGDICAVGAVLFVIDDGREIEDPNEVADAAPTSAAPRVAQEVTPLSAHRAPAADLEETDVLASVTKPPNEGTRVLATPATRRLARALNVELHNISGTGRNGRVTSEDVHQASKNDGAVLPPLSPANGAPHTAMVAVSTAPVATYSPAPQANEDRVPLRGVRKKIAENMTRSAFTAAHFTYVEEVDTTDLVEVRNRSTKKASERGIKLTYLPYIVKAAVNSLKKWPNLNTSLDEARQEIVIKRYYHIGIATQGPQGLAVTVVRDADKRSIFDIAQEIERLAAAVQNGTATRDDLTGSTFTVSSLGKLGGLMATPIINFPEVGIMGVHKMEQRAVIVDNQIVPRYRMNLSISLDHRLVDGWDGAMFLQDVKTLLEDPTLMFMEMV